MFHDDENLKLVDGKLTGSESFDFMIEEALVFINPLDQELVYSASEYAYFPVVEFKSDRVIVTVLNAEFLNVEYSLLNAKDVDFNKIANKDTFIFFIQKKGCAVCQKIYPEVSLFLDSNPEYLIYSISREEIKGYDSYSYAAFFSNCIGKQYYDEQLEGRYGELFSPSFARVVQGEFIDAKIGYVTAEEISYLYQLNYTKLI